MYRSHTPAETKAIRAKVVNHYALPIVKKAFKKYPQLNSAYFTVAQYWNDNAWDTLHNFILYSVLNVPDWKAFTKSEQQTGKKSFKDSINLPNFQQYHDRITSDVWGEIENILSDNFDVLTGEIVASFAAFCKEGSHQSMDYSEAYTPYALFTRSDERIKVEIVGKMLRPWLDGIRPED